MWGSRTGSGGWNPSQHPIRPTGTPRWHSETITTTTTSTTRPSTPTRALAINGKDQYVVCDRGVMYWAIGNL
jgi:hypothetical protein